MKKLILFALAFGILSCSSGGDKDTQKEPIKLETQQQRLSYAVGADHAHSISQSGDPNFSKYNLSQLVKGFAEGLDDENAFDDVCQEALRGLFGDEGRGFNEAFIDEGCECLGRLSGVVFVGGWKKKGGMEAMDKKYIIAGFEDGLFGADSIVSKNDQIELVQNLYEELNRKMGKKMLDEAMEKPNTQDIQGVVLETLEEGRGKSPTIDDKVQATYILINAMNDTLENSRNYEYYMGRKMDPFPLKGVIQGWQIAFPKMREGGKYMLYIPYQLAYGEQGAIDPQRNSYKIQPYEALKFYVELEGVVK